MGVPAGDQQAHALRQWAVIEDVGGQVPAEMVHRVERHAPCRGVGLRGGHTDHQRTGQSGTDGGRDDVGPVDTGSGQGPAHGRTQRLQVGAGRDLGNHPAETGVLVHAGGDLVGKQNDGAVGLDPGDADSGFVTGTFDGQDSAARHDRSRRMVCASAPLAW